MLFALEFASELATLRLTSLDVVSKLRRVLVWFTVTMMLLRLAMTVLILLGASTAIDDPADHNRRSQALIPRGVSSPAILSNIDRRMFSTLPGKAGDGDITQFCSSGHFWGGDFCVDHPVPGRSWDRRCTAGVGTAEVVPPKTYGTGRYRCASGHKCTWTRPFVHPIYRDWWVQSIACVKQPGSTSSHNDNSIDPEYPKARPSGGIGSISCHGCTSDVASSSITRAERAAAIAPTRGTGSIEQSSTAGAYGSHSVRAKRFRR